MNSAPFIASPAIVVTGGPCSGKTTAIEALPPTLAGFELLKVPEAATLYFERGGAVPFGAAADRSGEFTPLDRNLLWEAWLIELKISLENAAHAASAARQSRVAGGSGADETASVLPCAVVCDRGILDSRAYLSNDGEWHQVLALAGWDEAELLARYQGVVCLDVAPEPFYNLGNAARRESFAEAQAIHGHTWAAWRDAARRCDARADRTRADFAAEFDLTAAAAAARRAPSPVLVANPQDACPAAAAAAKAAASPFAAKVAALRACVEATLQAYAPQGACLGAGESPGGGPGAARQAPGAVGRWSMPVDFLVAQAHQVATSPVLGGGGDGVYVRSVALLRDLQRARRGDPQRRRSLMSEHQRDRAKRLFQL